MARTPGDAVGLPGNPDELGLDTEELQRLVSPQRTMVGVFTFFTTERRDLFS